MGKFADNNCAVCAFVDEARQRRIVRRIKCRRDDRVCRHSLIGSQRALTEQRLTSADHPFEADNINER